MPISAIAGGIGAASSLAGTAGNLFGGGGGSSSQVPAVYQEPNQPQIAQDYYNLISGTSLPGASSIPAYATTAYTNAYNELANNPYSGQAQQGANTAANYGTAVSPQQLAAASTLFGMGNNAVPYASQILQQGFDPQQSLYNQNFQKTMDQTNAINSMNGVAGTPYGAGLAGQNAQNFNINWNAQQLQNMINAAGGYGNLASSIGQGFTGASNLGGQAINTAATSSALPYSIFNTAYGNQISALNSVVPGITGSYGVTQNTLGDLMQYLGLGQSASAVGGQNAMDVFGQNQAYGQGVGSGLSSLSGLNWGSSPQYGLTDTNMNDYFAGDTNFGLAY